MTNTLLQGGDMSEVNQQTVGQETTPQNNNGWKLMTYFRAANGGYDSLAYKRALKKASSSDRQIMIRSYEKNSFTYWEVWEHW